MSQVAGEEPSSRRIAREALAFFLVMLVAGVAIISLRVTRDGSEVLAPTRAERQAR